MSEIQQSLTPKKTRLTLAARKNAFLVSFAQHGIVSRACKDANVSRTTVYQWKEHDTEFLVRYNLALEEAKDAVREEIHRRAQDGWDEEVYQLGHYAGTVHKYSDTLLIFRAKALMPEYRDKIDVNNVNQTIHQMSISEAMRMLSPEKLATVDQWLHEAEAARK